MKNRITTFAVLALFAFVASSRLPQGAPTSNTVTWRTDVSSATLFFGKTAVNWSEWQVDDYGVFKVAHSDGMNLTLVADPFTGKWNRVSGTP